MRYLLHSGEATYQTDQKEWLFSLDKRLMNPVEVTITQASFTCQSGLSPKPHVVYMRSRALGQMIRQKHTVELTTSNHHNSSNVLAVLSETHDRGRYKWEGRTTLQMDPSSSVRTIDLYFTDGNTRLEGEYELDDGSPVVSTEADIEAFHALSRTLIWLPMTQSTLLQASYAPVAAVGDETVRYILNRPTHCPQNVIFSTYGNVGFGILGQTNSIYGGITSWNHAIDSNNNPDFPNDTDYQFHCLFKTGSSVTGHFFKTRAFRLWFSSNTIAYTSEQYGTQTTNLLLFPNQDFLLSVCRRTGSIDDDGDAVLDKRLFFTLKNLTLDTADQTYEGTDAESTYDSQHHFSIANASTGWTMHLGPTLLLTGGDDATKNTCRSYLTSLYSDAAVAGESEVTTENASFFTELLLKQA